MTVEDKQIEIRQQAEVTAETANNDVEIASKTVTVPEGEIWYVDKAIAGYEQKIDNDSYSHTLYLDVHLMSEHGLIKQGSGSNSGLYSLSYEDSYTTAEIGFYVSGGDTIRFQAYLNVGFNSDAYVRNFHGSLGIRRVS